MTPGPRNYDATGLLAAPNLGVLSAVIDFRLVDAVRIDIGRHIVLGDDVEGLDKAASGGAVEGPVQLIDRLPALQPGGLRDRAELVFAGLDPLIGSGTAVGTDERDAAAGRDAAGAQGGHTGVEETGI